MDSDIKVRIVKWNRDRGLLGGFDPAFELKMLSEEANEFYAAESLAHMMAEYCDFLFVSGGTKAKYYSQKLESLSLFSLAREGWVELQDWINEVRDDMAILLYNKFNYKYEDGYDDAVYFAMNTVIANNELKGSKKINGKIVKSANHIDPVITIEKYLNA